MTKPHTTIRLGGVPEHFNLPVQQAAAQFKAAGLDVQWREFPDGTGAMCKALRAKEIDVALILTEGIVKDILQGNNSKIVGTYVESPLMWGVHTPATSTIETVADVREPVFAVSRFNSGSHLMALLYAKAKGWQLDESRFHVVGTIEKAAEALAAGEADLFLWEKYMTMPWVEDNIFRRIDTFSASWPCFSIAAHTQFWEAHKQPVQTFIKLLLKQAEQFKTNEESPSEISQQFGLTLQAAEEWWTKVAYSAEGNPDAVGLQGLVETLVKNGVFDTQLTAAEVRTLLLDGDEGPLL